MHDNVTGATIASMPLAASVSRNHGMPTGTRRSVAGFRAIAPEAADMPLYRVVKRALLQAIEAGAYPPGAVLPNETALATTFGV